MSSLQARRTRRDWLIDGAAIVAALAVGAVFFLSSAVYADRADSAASSHLAVDVTCGLFCCVSLWWSRRWPLFVALVCVALGAVSVSATAAGLLALFALAVRGPVRHTMIAAAMWLPSTLVFVLYRPDEDVAGAVLACAFALAATAWGMYVRARRQLLLTLRERALRAEADRLLHEDNARMVERTRIAREMHDVLAHRISLVALHAGALELRPDLPAEQVRETAELLRGTAHQALEELRSVIGVLREDAGVEPAELAPQPTLSDIPRLVDETRRAGARIELDMEVEHPDDAPSALGRDAYRIVQEALTNITKHANGTSGQVRVAGAERTGLHVTIRNRLPLQAMTGPSLPGAGAGLLGLHERVALAGGTLIHGPDGSGDFVVEARLRW